MMKKLIFALGVIGCVGSAWTVSTVHAAELTSKQLERFDSLVGEAVEHYSAGRYENAIELFERAFAVHKEPELLYNIGRCYERLAVPDAAVQWYEKFLEMPGTTGELRTKALNNITTLRKEIEALEESHNASEQRRTQTEGEYKGDASGNDDRGEQDQPVNPMNIAGWSLVGVGGAALIAGGIFGGLALAEKGDYDDAGFDADRLGYRDDLERNALVFDVVFFSGAALAAAGATLLIVNALKDETAQDEEIESAKQSVSLTPSLIADRNNLGFGLQGSF